MLNSRYIGTYWLNRSESIEDCTRRSELLFRLLRECDPGLSRWYEKGWTLEEALSTSVNVDASSLEAKFREQSTEEGRMVGEGFALSLWNGEPSDGGSGLSLLCNETSPAVSNRCVLHPPEEGPLSERLWTPAFLTRLLQAMVRAWEPEWGLATSHELQDLLPASSQQDVSIGWLTYISHRRGPLPALPPPVHVEPVDGLGSLVLLTPERFSPANPSHLQLARDVTALLAQAGLLHPLRPWDDERP